MSETVKAVRLHGTGGPEVLQWDDVEVGDPGPGEVRLRHTAIGVNFSDIYRRTRPTNEVMPLGIGLEGAGVIEAVGEGVTGFKEGDRVAYGDEEHAAYSEKRVLRAFRVVALPDGISDNQAAAMMVKGTTARYLVKETYAVRPGDVILVQAAAGGVGLISIQWAKHLGATIIGTVGSEEKAGLVKALGCDYPIVYTQEDFVARVREITGGEGVNVVYESVGRDTYIGSLDCLKKRGLLVLCGQSSGAVPPISPGEIRNRGSLYMTQPNLWHYADTREAWEANVLDLFDVVLSGAVKIEVNQTYALKDAAEAHRDLEARKTSGQTILVP